MSKLFFILVIWGISNYPQDSTKIDIDFAYANAVKGINWALNNIPDKKQRLDNDLIENNTLLSAIKLSKEVNGYKIESTGFYLNSELTIKVYRSDDWLLNKGYIKPVIKEEPVQEKKKVTVKGRKKQKNTI